MQQPTFVTHFPSLYRTGYDYVIKRSLYCPLSTHVTSDVWGLHDGENLETGLLSYAAVQSFTSLPTFRWNILFVFRVDVNLLRNVAPAYTRGGRYNPENKNPILVDLHIYGTLLTIAHVIRIIKTAGAARFRKKRRVIPDHVILLYKRYNGQDELALRAF